MKDFLPYLFIPLAMLLLFLRARGMFAASAQYLLRKFRRLSDYTTAETLSRTLMILLAADLLAAAASVSSRDADTAALGYLERQDYGGSDEEETLQVTLDGTETHELTLDIAARQLSHEEIQSAFSDAAEMLETTVFGAFPYNSDTRGSLTASSPPAGSSSEHSSSAVSTSGIYVIRSDLPLPAELENSPVKISWYTSRPDILSDDGQLQEELPDSKNGIPVTLTAEMTCGDEIRSIDYELLVFPKEYSPKEQTEQDILSAVREASDRTSSTVQLPSEIDGKSASWKIVSEDTGIPVLGVGLLIAFFYIYSRKRLKELDSTVRKEQLKRDYPDLVGKLVLLLTAGMSTRNAFGRIAEDYQKDLSCGGSARPAFDEICVTVRDMERGVAETAAYEELGRRCDLPLYRTFATLLVENLRKGGSDMRLVMERESIEALEERKKTARILGEQAGTKLLFPMVLMLAVVMVVLIVPSFLTFF